MHRVLGGAGVDLHSLQGGDIRAVGKVLVVLGPSIIILARSIAESTTTLKRELVARMALPSSRFAVCAVRP